MQQIKDIIFRKVTVAQSVSEVHEEHVSTSIKEHAKQLKNFLEVETDYDIEKQRRYLAFLSRMQQEHNPTIDENLEVYLETAKLYPAFG
jgi:hypothetical protein